MDGLALLCNLYAEGHQTLRRLRGLGVGSLADLLARGEPSLASVIGPSRPAIRQLLEAARQLEQRLSEAPRETGSKGEASEPARRIAVRPALRAFEPSEAPTHTSVVPVIPSGLLRGEAGGVTELPEVPRAPRPLGAIAGDLRPALSGRGRGDTADDALRPGAIEGLDARVCELLARAGVRTPRELAELVDLSLAPRLGLAFARLLDLSFAARQYLQTLAPAPRPSGAREPETRVVTLHPTSPQERPRTPAFVGRARADDPAPPCETREGGTIPEGVRDDPGVAGPFV